MSDQFDADVEQLFRGPANGVPFTGQHPDRVMIAAWGRSLVAETRDKEFKCTIAGAFGLWVDANGDSSLLGKWLHKATKLTRSQFLDGEYKI